MLTFICYPKCTTCIKAQRWLDAHGVEYEIRNIKDRNPTKEELARWIADGGLPVRKLFNTSGLLYRSMDLKNRLPLMSEAEALELLGTDGMLVKRPLLIGDGTVLAGFSEKLWQEKLL